MKERNTKQKYLILEAVKGRLVHPTAEDVFREIKQSAPTVSLATVYRNLNNLAEKGVIKKLQIPGYPDRFEKNLTNHYHFCCEKCGGFWDAEGIEYRREMNGITTPNGFKITEHDIIIKGICLKCRKGEILNELQN